MGENLELSAGKPRNYKPDRGGMPVPPGAYIGIVKNNVDSARSGKLQVYIQPVEEAREKLDVLRGLISDQNWVDTRTWIHGPLGKLRQEMLGLSRSLLPKDQDEATRLAREVFGHLERLDASAKERSLSAAGVQYAEALKDYDAFLNLIPTAS
jgi:photosystem II protein PsbQ